ncbi:hypothetical protein A3768_0746 [Ralstonia solanacearum]|nr:hypothetical protein F504_2752 [Ralstonia pseudosolanacearum FQY_4]ANH31921.1 hypothetical protein A3768_0746 [Ralstonia solanacearum]
MAPAAPSASDRATFCRCGTNARVTSERALQIAGRSANCPDSGPHPPRTGGAPTAKNTTTRLGGRAGDPVVGPGARWMVSQTDS